MSMLAANHIWQTLAIGPLMVYTFGSPRVGNAAFALHLEAHVPRLFRIVNAADLVPHLPACTFNKSAATKPCVESKDGYYHAGVELWFPHGDYQHGVMCGYRSCLRLPRGEDTYCINSLFSIGYPPSRFDHHRYFDVVPVVFCGSSMQSTIIV